jgi:hypothetical protein
VKADDLRRRLDRLEAAAPAGRDPDETEFAAMFEVMTDQELDAWFEAHLAEKAKDPEWVRQQEEFAARLEALSTAELEARMLWYCTDPRTRREWKWPTT